MSGKDKIRYEINKILNGILQNIIPQIKNKNVPALIMYPFI